MCGRYTLVVSLEELMFRYGIEELPNHFHTPRYNVAPMQMMAAIIHDGEARRMGELKWGLVPSWAEDDKIGGKMINARAETILEKPSFKTLISRRRCLIPADGFYEWKRVGTSKQPMRITMKDRSIFSMAGLYDIWVSPKGNKIGTFTIITTKPNKLMADIHDRMPVILPREQEDSWIRRQNQDAGQLVAMLKPYPPELMLAYPVSPKVGSVKNDSPDLIEAVGGNAQQATLF